MVDANDYQIKAVPGVVCMRVESFYQPEVLVGSWMVD